MTLDCLYRKTKFYIFVASTQNEEKLLPKGLWEAISAWKSSDSAYSELVQQLGQQNLKKLSHLKSATSCAQGSMRKYALSVQFMSFLYINSDIKRVLEKNIDAVIKSLQEHIIKFAVANFSEQQTLQLIDIFKKQNFSVAEFNQLADKSPTIAKKLFDDKELFSRIAEDTEWFGTRKILSLGFRAGYGNEQIEDFYESCHRFIYDGKSSPHAIYTLLTRTKDEQIFNNFITNDFLRTIYIVNNTPPKQFLLRCIENVIEFNRHLSYELLFTLPKITFEKDENDMLISLAQNAINNIKFRTISKKEFLEYQNITAQINKIDKHNIETCLRHVLMLFNVNPLSDNSNFSHITIIVHMYLLKATNENIEKIAELIESLPKFSEYLRDLRRVPHDQLDSIRSKYTKDICKIIINADLNDLGQLKQTIALEKQQQAIETRRMWGDVVAATAKHNKQLVNTNNISTKVVKRLKNLGFTQEPEALLKRMLAYLKTCRIVVTFDAGFIEELDFHQLLNMFKKNHRDLSYFSSRNNCERLHFSYLPTDLYNNFIRNLSARPRYGALWLLGPNEKQLPQAISNYGNSFVVLRPTVMSNALFVCDDSLTYKSKNLTSWTADNFVGMLSKCSEQKLQAIAYRVTTGEFPAPFSQQYSTVFAPTCGYIEAMLPAIDISDPSQVELIHVNPQEKILSKKAVAYLSQTGITVTNGKNPYPGLYNKFFAAIFSKNHERIRKLVRKHPILHTFTDRNDKTGLMLATITNSTAVVKALLNPDTILLYRDMNKFTALHYAAMYGRENILELLIDRLELNNTFRELTVDDIVTIKSTRLAEAYFNYFKIRKRTSSFKDFDKIAHLSKKIAQELMADETIFTSLTTSGAYKTKKILKLAEHAGYVKGTISHSDIRASAMLFVNNPDTPKHTIRKLLLKTQYNEIIQQAFSQPEICQKFLLDFQDNALLKKVLTIAVSSENNDLIRVVLENTFEPYAKTKNQDVELTDLFQQLLTININHHKSTPKNSFLAQNPNVSALPKAKPFVNKIINDIIKEKDTDMINGLLSKIVPHQIPSDAKILPANSLLTKLLKLKHQQDPTAQTKVLNNLKIRKKALKKAVKKRTRSFFAFFYRRSTAKKQDKITELRKLRRTLKRNILAQETDKNIQELQNALKNPVLTRGFFRSSYTKKTIKFSLKQLQREHKGNEDNSNNSQAHSLNLTAPTS